MKEHLNINPLGYGRALIPFFHPLFLFLMYAKHDFFLKPTIILIYEVKNRP